MIATAERAATSANVYELLPLDPYANGGYTYMVQAREGELPAGVTYLKPLNDGVPAHISRGHRR